MVQLASNFTLDLERWFQFSLDVALFQALLQLHQLTHEVEVRRNDGTFRLDEFVSVAHAHQSVLHNVGDGDCGRARDASLTVDQHSTVSLPTLICKESQAEGST